MRNKVIWLGDPPTDHKEFNRRNLTVVAVQDAAAAIVQLRSGARSVLIPFSAGLRDKLVEAYFPVLDSGASLDVVLLNSAAQAADRASATLAVATIKKSGGESLVRTLNGWDLHH